MHRFIVLIGFEIALVLALSKECALLTKPGLAKCCVTPVPRPSKDLHIKECFDKFRKLPKSPTNCELDLCIGKKLGYVSDNETIDKNALETEIDNKFKDRPELAEDIKNKCVNSDLKDYEPDGLCELKKRTRCIQLHFMTSCPEFHDNRRCSKVKDLQEKCAVE